MCLKKIHINKAYVTVNTNKPYHIYTDYVWCINYSVGPHFFKHHI